MPPHVDPGSCAKCCVCRGTSYVLNHRYRYILQFIHCEIFYVWYILRKMLFKLNVIYCHISACLTINEPAARPNPGHNPKTNHNCNTFIKQLVVVSIQINIVTRSSNAEIFIHTIFTTFRVIVPLPYCTFLWSYLCLCL